MVRAFLKFIDTHKLIAKNDRVLLAVSGGADSTALAHLFSKTEIPFGISHCNFQLRGAESEGDEKFVRQLAAALGVNCHVKRFDTGTVSSVQNISIQMAARDLRYAWFEELLQRGNYTKIATAHHKNDTLETVIFNLTKGTGIAGFHGIKVKRGKVIRPLLFATRNEVEQYLRKNKLEWQDDTSNESEKYHRNLIRKKVIPLLKQINPNLENSMEQTVAKMGAVEEFFADKMEAMKSQLLESRNGDWWISIKKLRKIKGAEIVLFELLKPYGFNFAQSVDVISATASHPGKLFYSETHVLNVDRDHLVLSEIQGNALTFQIEAGDELVTTPYFSLQCRTLPKESFALVASGDIAFLDLGKLRFPLQIRQWQQGDFFYPLGMKNRKKLSDFMIDEKIPVNLKSKVFVLLSGEDIVWVIGHRIDNRYKVTDTTREVCQISKLPHHAENI